MFKFIVNGKEVSYEYFNITKIMKETYSKMKMCNECDLTNICTGYDCIPSRAELKIELK